MAKKAGMSTGIEVARITVKVSPDTREFRRELKRELDDFEKGAKDKAKAKLNVDTEEATKKVSRSTEKMAQTASKNLSKIKVLDVNPLENFAQSMADFNAANKKMEADFSRSVAAMEKKAGTLDLKWDKKVQNLRMENFKPQADFAQARAESNRIMQEFEIQYDKVRRAGDNLEVTLRPDMKWFDPRIVRAQIRNWFGGKPVEIPVTATDPSGKGGGGKDMAAILAKGGKAGKFPFPSFGSGINPAGWAAIVAGLMVVTAPLIGLVTTALTTLPGLVALISAPIAAITLGLDGFKKAAEAIKPQFDALKTTMSEAAETSFTPVMTSIADTIFPLLQESLPRVTQGLADFAQGAIDAFKSPENATMFQNSIQRIGEAFSAMKPGMNDFLSGFIGLIDAFTLKLPDITEWFNKTGGDFKNWVAEMTAGGENSKLSTAFDQLGKFIRTVLDLLGELAGSSMDFMGKTGSIDGFTASFKKLGEVLQGLVKLSQELNEKWQVLVQGTRFLSGVTSILQGDGPGAFNNFKDFFTNKPWNEGVKSDVDAVTGSLNEAGAAADANAAKVDNFFSGNDAREKRGLPKIQGPGLNGDMPTSAPAQAGAPKVPVPDTSAAEAKIQEYKQTVATVLGEVQSSLNSAEALQLPAPQLSVFLAAFDGLSDKVRAAVDGARAAATQSVQGIVEVFTSGGALIALTVASWPGRVKEALAPLATAGTEIASAMVSGMVAGINAGIPQVTAAARTLATEALNAAKAALESNSPSKKFIQLGKDTGAGMGIGMEQGFAPVLLQAKDIAWKISEAFANGGDPTASLNGFDDKEVTRLEKVLGFEAKRLELQAKALTYQSKITGNESLKAKAEELRMQKDQITLQKEMLDLTQEYADLNGEGTTKLADSPFASIIEDGMKMPFDFAQATGKQFLSDIGIGGNGALSAIADYGTGLASNFVFNVSNIDEAMAVQRNQVAKQSLGVIGR